MKRRPGINSGEMIANAEAVLKATTALRDAGFEVASTRPAAGEVILSAETVSGMLAELMSLRALVGLPTTKA